ncbi:MAG: hypothetical protein LC790_01465 [Actinobacteria bacterium]|nr:hypothetical protein [Actinomycetota bacterium]
MTLPLLIIVLVASAIVGVITRRWLAIALSIAMVGMFYVGLDSGWWGEGTGDGWQYSMAISMALGAAITAIAVGISRVSRR